MQTGSETAGGKSDSSGGGADPQKEAAYWREQRSKQPYAKGGSYEQFEHAYKTGYNSFFKYPGQNFADVEDDVALGYEEAKTRCSAAMGHGASRGERHVGQIGRHHQPAIPVAACASGSEQGRRQKTEETRAPCGTLGFDKH